MESRGKAVVLESGRLILLCCSRTEAFPMLRCNMELSVMTVEQLI